MRDLILRCKLSLGDIVLLTAAVRDLHRRFPRRYRTDVRTSFPDLWLHNPHLTPLGEYDPSVGVLDCDYPLVHQSDECASHCLHGFMSFLSRRLGVDLQPTEFKGDIHLSRAEKSRPSPILEWTGRDLPFWIVSAGGKFDYTIKWWAAERFQEVIDHFRGRIQFVQVGAEGHHHPKLQGAIDLRGRTPARELIRLVHHAQGVLCGVTGLMHLAAAVPRPAGIGAHRPCVVVAGGRESPGWEAYPGHQFIHTVGALPCCAEAGCWRSRTLPVGDGDEKDRPDNLCLDVRGQLPRCMDLISSAEVIRRIEVYFEGGVAKYLGRAEAAAARQGVAATADHSVAPEPLTLTTAAEAAARKIASIPPCPDRFRGRGIVICGGGVKLFTNAWVCIQRLRALGCTLPIQLWYLGEIEVDERMIALVAPFGVECVDACSLREKHPARLRHGWALKPYAILHCSFEEVLLLDADNVPVRNPEFLFEAEPYRRAGAVFWPDFNRLQPGASAWSAFDVPYRDEPEFESGQILVNKRRCWEPLVLSMWYNEHSDFFYKHVHGDKETFHLAFRKLNRPYAMPAKPIHALRDTMCQHDFSGRRLFQHRNGAKWSLFDNPRIRGFQFEAECRKDLARLDAIWDGRMSHFRPKQSDSPAVSVAIPPRRSKLNVAAFMVSCPERETVRRRTLARLSRTDWGNAPVRLITDERKFNSRVDNLTHSAWRAFREGLKTSADYLLFLEDDSDFNRHLRHNLEAWEPLRQRSVTLAGLYNPGLVDAAWDVPAHAVVVHPHTVFGSHALLLSRETIEFLLDHWFEGPPALDLKIGRLAARMRRPVYYHRPSLVQHVGQSSTLKNGFHQAPDFAPTWRAAGPPEKRVSWKPK